MKISPRRSRSGSRPELDWRKRYAGWKALQKLEYVDELMRSLAGKPPVHTPEYRVADYNCLNVKLKTYYARKRKLYEDTYPDFYDADLRQLFAAAGAGRSKPARICAGRRRRLLNSVCQWTNEKKFRVNKLLARLIDRCDQLELACAQRRSAAGFSRYRFHYHAGDELSFHRQIQAHQISVKKKLKVLVLFDGTSPTTIDQDLSEGDEDGGLENRGERHGRARRARSHRGASRHLRRSRSGPAKTGELRARRSFQSRRAVQEQPRVRSEHRFVSRNAGRALYRLRLDRADALQTQGHLEKDPAVIIAFTCRISSSFRAASGSRGRGNSSFRSWSSR